MNELDAEDAEQAFQRFTHGPLAAPATFLVARGDLKLYTDTYSPPDGFPSDELIKRHDRLENLSKGEGERHLRAKLLGASYLESKGFDVQRKRSDPLEYDCFEEKIEGHATDVVADSESGTVCLESAQCCSTPTTNNASNVRCRCTLPTSCPQVSTLVG